jgi:hypothetical protein
MMGKGIALAEALKTYVDGLKGTAAEKIKEMGDTAADIGKFKGFFDEWQADGGTQRAGTICEWNGAVYVCDVDTMRINGYDPATLLQTNYSLRPEPDAQGVYPYRWGMAVMKGMRVRENGVVYKCILETGEKHYKLIYAPSAVPALFTRE